MRGLNLTLQGRKQSECIDEMEVNMQNKTNCENGLEKKQNKTEQNKTQTKTRKTHKKQR